MASHMTPASWLTVTPSRPLRESTPPVVSATEAEPAAHAFSQLLERAARPTDGAPARSGASRGPADPSARGPAAPTADAAGASARTTAQRAGSRALAAAEAVTPPTPAGAASLLAAAAQAQAAETADALRAGTGAARVEPAAPEEQSHLAPEPDEATPATPVALAGDAAAGLWAPVVTPTASSAAGTLAAEAGSAAPTPDGDPLGSIGRGRAGTAQAEREAAASDTVALGPAKARPVPLPPEKTDGATPAGAPERMAAQPGAATERTPDAAPTPGVDARRKSTPPSDPVPPQAGLAASTALVAATAVPDPEASTPAAASGAAASAASAAWAARSATAELQTAAGAARAGKDASTDGPTDRASGIDSGGLGARIGASAPDAPVGGNRASSDAASAAAATAAPNAAFTLDVRRSEAVTTHRLAASPGSVGFGAELGTQITTFVRDGVQHARLELSPAEMGPVTVQIQLDGQAAQVHLAADNADTRRALEQSMPQLAATLREAGLTLSGGGVFEQPRSPQQERASNPSRSAGRGLGAESGATASDSAPAAPIARRRGVVDLVA
jgi:flagellar hook-length control protein FliK